MRSLGLKTAAARQATAAVLPALASRADRFRRAVSSRLDAERRKELGQFLTPPRVSQFMAALFPDRPGTIRLLDAGAGAGALTAALADEFCRRRHKPREIVAVTYEIEPALADCLRETLRSCTTACKRAGIRFVGEVHQEDFVEAGCALLRNDLFSAGTPAGFDCAILNPPYRKLPARSRTRQLLHATGIEAGNLYAAFLAVAIRLLNPGGDLVAITPRSFCNGPYFTAFRRLLLSAMTLRRLHVFDSRNRAFGEDEVLQENIVFRAVKGVQPPARVTISSSPGPGEEYTALRCLALEEVVHPGDADCFIHLALDDPDRRLVACQ